ncbi:hypothetical protein SAMN05421788_101421 [Filimonas lacunae]|uniref:Uncharacterized protein n=1 Tax=Filimonas lacunae TaxID=477680 RepID=A0A173MMV4_9BACT|nr:hypothetical protein [Filimonas lacunae]BAV08972.1 hypothetical protein FLA_5019 [Filimonas lacunae]SIS65025.1 hypothetical protein SAMN05421788_101421 [Filimonas lacunae]
MENDLRHRTERKGFTTMRVMYDITMGIIILGMGALVLLGDKLKITQIQSLDPLMRYIFAGICAVYGGFRLYRGLKRDY